MNKKSAKIRSILGETEVPHNPVRTWSVSDASGFEIPEGTERQYKEEMPPPGLITNPLYAQQKQQNVQHDNRQEAYEQIYNHNQQNRATTVGDALDAREQFHRQAEQGQASTMEHARRRIDMLIGFGVSSDEVEVEFDGQKMTFGLRTLKGREQKNVQAFVEKNGQILPNGKLVMSSTNQSELRCMCLAYALISVDGADLDDVLGIHQYEDKERFEVRMEFLDELDDGLKSRLFMAFEKLAADHNKKYHPKTEEEVREVTEQISKSGQGIA